MHEVNQNKMLRTNKQSPGKFYVLLWIVGREKCVNSRTREDQRQSTPTTKSDLHMVFSQLRIAQLPNKEERETVRSHYLPHSCCACLTHHSCTKLDCGLCSSALLFEVLSTRTSAESTRTRAERVAIKQRACRTKLLGKYQIVAKPHLD